LTPSERTASGHRLYTADDVQRLQQIRSLQQLGFSLAEIRDFVARPDYRPRTIIDMQIRRLDERIALQQKLRGRLERIATRLDAEVAVEIDEFFEMIKEIDMVERFEKYYTKEQLDYLAERREIVGEKRIREAEKEWPELIRAVRAEMAKGTDPAGETMQELARRWQSLIDEFTGGDPGIIQALCNMYRQEPNIAADYGYTPDASMTEYIGKAIQACNQASS
jgi:DNA-binding transcriptional MerR regulator